MSLAAVEFGVHLVDKLAQLRASLLEPIAVIGLLGQVVFFGRFLVQWLVSERAKRSVVPPVFWYMSLAGSALVLLYAILKGDGVIALGQSTGFIVYLRNLALIRRNNVSASRSAP